MTLKRFLICCKSFGCLCPPEVIHDCDICSVFSVSMKKFSAVDFCVVLFSIYFFKGESFDIEGLLKSNF